MSSEPTFQLYQLHTKQLIGKFIPRLLGQPEAVLADLDRFRGLVVEPAWLELPESCRQLGRDVLAWDELFDELLSKAYRADAGVVGLRLDAKTKMTDAFRSTMQAVAKRLAALQRSAAQSQTVPREGSSGTDASSKYVPTLGIDLGTTFSALAYVDAHGRPVSIRNADGDLLTPSVVLFDEDSVIVGKEALATAVFEPDRVAICAKREMGQRVFSKPINGEQLPPQVISSIILRSLKSDAERRFDQPLQKAVITVPAYFDERRRQATVDAGRMAGIDVLDIINEPTAAAVAFGHQHGFLDSDLSTSTGETIRVMVYDLGGGTFDVTILEVCGNSFTAVATDGDVLLGGKDWDQVLVDLAAERFAEKHGADPRSDPAATLDLEAAAENTKRSLSERTHASLRINFEGSRMKVEVTREEFEEATLALLNRTRQTTELVLREAGFTWPDISRVLLIGGSTRMPMVGRMLEDISGQSVDRSMSPDEAVAQGAALYADMLERREHAQSAAPERFKLTNVNSHALGIVGIDQKTGRKVNHILIPKNTPLPHAVDRTFKTAKQGQRSVKVEVLEGENAVPDYCTQVGVSAIRDLPRDLPAGVPVQIRYELRENGRLKVTARMQEAAIEATFARNNSLDADELKTWTAYVDRETGGTKQR